MKKITSTLLVTSSAISFFVCSEADETPSSSQNNEKTSICDSHYNMLYNNFKNIATYLFQKKIWKGIKELETITTELNTLIDTHPEVKEAVRYYKKNDWFKDKFDPLLQKKQDCRESYVMFFAFTPIICQESYYKFKSFSISTDRVFKEEDYTHLSQLLKQRKKLLQDIKNK